MAIFFKYIFSCMIGIRWMHDCTRYNERWWCNDCTNSACKIWKDLNQWLVCCRLKRLLPIKINNITSLKKTRDFVSKAHVNETNLAVSNDLGQILLQHLDSLFTLKHYMRQIRPPQRASEVHSPIKCSILPFRCGQHVYINSGPKKPLRCYFFYKRINVK